MLVCKSTITIIHHPTLEVNKNIKNVRMIYRMTLLCNKLKHDPKMVNYLNISVEEDTLQYVDPNLIELISNRETGEICSLAQKAKEQIDIFSRKSLIYIRAIFQNKKSVKNSKNCSLTFQSRIIYG